MLTVVRLVAFAAILVACRDGVAMEPAGAPSRDWAGAMELAQAPIPAAEEIVDAVSAIAAPRLGLPVRDIDPDADFLDDLLADPMDALDIVALACEAFGLPPPRDDRLTTVSAIAAYIESALRAREAAAGTRQLVAADRLHVQEVFFATDRNATRSLDPNDAFGPHRAANQRMSYGLCEVTIPIDVHREGQVERPSLLSLEWAEDPQKHIVLRSVRPMNRADWLTALNTAEIGLDDVLVFIHGYKVAFADAARRTAQIAYDLEFPGVPIFYSWPSNAQLLDYLWDREDVEWSAPHIAEFLRTLVSETGAGRLHLVAHSMGNQGLIRALHQIALRLGPDADALFENVILAAPDFDAQVFTDQIAPEIVHLARRWTLYVSDKDQALLASSVLSVPRLGSPLAIAPGIDTIDASGIDVTPWSVPEFHSYYASKRRVIVDLIGVLQGLAPSQRRLLVNDDGPIPYWVMDIPEAGSD